MPYKRDAISCFGHFGFVEAPHEFHFRAYPDGKLSATVQRKSTCSWMTQNDFKTTQNTYEEALNDNRKITFAVINGLAKKHEESGEYDVKFIVATSGAGMFCRRKLSAEGLVGTFQHLKYNTSMRLSGNCDKEFGSYGDPDEEQDEELAFELVAREGRFEVENIQDPLDALTPGEYKFHGTEFTNFYDFDYFNAAIDLRPDGTMIISLAGSVYWMETEGTWSPSGFISIGYENDGEYCGGMELTSSIQMLRGQGIEPPDRCHYRFEWAIVELELDSCRKRAWSKALHVQFPPEFCQSVKWLLLYSHRGHQDPFKASLPREIWPHVLKFTSDRWFN